MKVGLVVPVLNNFQGACELLASITTDYPWTPYVMPQWRAQVPLAAAWNNGIDQALEDDCEYVLVSNDDVMLAPYSIDALVAELERLRSEGVVLVSANNILGQLQSPHQILDYKEPEREPMVADHPNYSCFLIGRDFFDKVGRFDTNFNPAWWEDSDSHYRIHLLGFRAVCTTAAPSVHIGGVTTRLLPNVNSGISEAYFLKKWGSTKRDLNEVWKTPYNDPNLTPRDWR